MAAHGYVTWEFEPDIIRLGGTMTLICTIDNLMTINKGLIRQWSKGSELICFNGHPIDSKKYIEIVTDGNQFKLQINNLTESDLNDKYKCRYSFETQTKDVNLSEINFEYPPTNETKAMIHTNALNRTLVIHLHLEKVFPMPNCTAIIEDKHLSFEVMESIRYDFFYDIQLEHRSAHILKCNQNVEVSCMLQLPYSIQSQRTESCQITDESITIKTVILIISIISGLYIVFSLVIITVIERKRKKRSDRQEEYTSVPRSSGSSSRNTDTTTSYSSTDENQELNKPIIYLKNVDVYVSDLKEDNIDTDKENMVKMFNDDEHIRVIKS